MFETVDEARAAFRADRAMLEERGVILPFSMQRYLTEREKRNGVLAMDVVTGYQPGMSGLPGPLSTDPNAALPWMLTSAIDPEIIRVAAARPSPSITLPASPPQRADSAEQNQNLLNHA